MANQERILHGPLLPKNPQLADWLIAHALEQKYGKEIRLAPLDDTEESSKCLRISSL
ncbi:MAG: hypothetical protein ACLU4P_03150 [Ruminococcus sp.]